VGTAPPDHPQAVAGTGPSATPRLQLGIVMVCGQKVALGRLHRWQTVTIAVSDTTLAVELPDQEPKIIRRTTSTAVRNIKAARPRPGTSQVV
jgi:hypothetical protein